MKRVLATLALAVFALATPARAEEDALPIVKKAFEAARANEALVRQYAYRERIHERRFKKNGDIKREGSRTYDVTLLDGSEYRRLVLIDDKPLYAETEAKEQARLEKQLEKMRKETPKKRAKRMAKIEKGRKEGEKFLEEITKAFDFRVTGEEPVDGIDTWIISAEPKAGYEPPSREAKVLTRVRGTIWIAKDDHAWVQADLETTDVLKYALVFKLHEGARVQFKQHRINDEVWMTETWQVRMRARAALFFKFNGEMSGRYSDFKKFTTDSEVHQGDVAPSDPPP